MASKTYRVVKISYLGGSDMMITLFIESNAENDPEIDKLLKVIKFMTHDEQISKTFTDKKINSYLNNPLAQVFQIGKGGVADHLGVYMLSGKFTFPSEITVPQTITKTSKSELSDVWEKSLLRCTKFPKWDKVCENVKRF